MAREDHTNGKGSDRQEWLKCRESFSYFVYNYCYIYDATAALWIPFQLWEGQMHVADVLVKDRLVVILKARQLGLTWLVLCFMLWRMLFHPIFTGLIFSRREIEAIYLLSKDRIRGVYNRLPKFMQVRQILTDSAHIWQLSNESVVYGFPTSAGDSYTASFAFVDEADLIPDLDNLMTAVKPTIDGGGGMVLLSRSDKETPNSRFKRIYNGAARGLNTWTPIFLPWHTRPERTKEWYEEQRLDSLTNTGSLDDLFEQYPSTAEEALRGSTLDKRFPISWLKRCYDEQLPLQEEPEVAIPSVEIFIKPQLHHEYVIGADPAEGNPGSDDSVSIVMDVFTGEEAAILSGKFEPSVFAEYTDMLATYYNNAEVLPERNNHGHAFILAMEEIHERDVMKGPDGKEGWIATHKGKALAYTDAADALRDRLVTIHSVTTFTQLASIKGDTLKAPEGDFDDYAMAYVLAIKARKASGVHAEYGENPTSGYRG